MEAATYWSDKVMDTARITTKDVYKALACKVGGLEECEITALKLHLGVFSDKTIDF